MRDVRTNELIDEVNCHNEYCLEVIEDLGWDPKDQDLLMKKYHENLELGIMLCCEMRDRGFDACVDRLTGAVVNSKEVDLDEVIDEEDGLRYYSFEYVKEEA